MAEELYKVHRPQVLKHVFGQDEAIAVLAGFGRAEGGLAKNLPHAILFTGPSGTGKTTLARILRQRLRCGDADFVEINAADFRGVDTIRDIRQRVQLSPIGGDCRVYLVDECHKLTGEAQNAFLKLLEDTPEHVWFFLATTEPNKLLRTVVTRCTEVKLTELTEAALRATIDHVCKEEELTLDPAVVARIVEVAEGSARKALVVLNQVRGHATPEQQLAVIERADYKTETIDLCRLLLNTRTTWDQVAKVLRGFGKANKGQGNTDADGKEYTTSLDNPESIRWAVLGYMSSVILGGGPAADRAYRVIQIFRDNWFDCKKAGLLACCYEVVTGK